MQWISVLISAGALLCSVLIVTMTRKRDSRNDIDKEIRTAESFKEINVKLDYQSERMNEVAINFRTNTKEIQELHDKYVSLNAKIDKAFDYIDAIRGRKE